MIGAKEEPQWDGHDRRGDLEAGRVQMSEPANILRLWQQFRQLSLMKEKGHDTELSSDDESKLDELDDKSKDIWQMKSWENYGKGVCAKRSAEEAWGLGEVVTKDECGYCSETSSMKELGNAIQKPEARRSGTL